MYMEWYLTIIVLRKGFSHRDVCGMYMEWYLTIICLRLSECCWIILRQSWGDYPPIFTSAPVLLNGKHNFWQGIGTLVISYNNNNFFFCISCLPSQDLINHMLVVDDNKRFSALQVLNHSWIKVIIISSSLFNSFLVYISGRSKIHRLIFTGKRYLTDVLQTFGLWLIVAKKFLTL